VKEREEDGVGRGRRGGEGGRNAYPHKSEAQTTYPSNETTLDI
jgi:hypothetical protein